MGLSADAYARQLQQLLPRGTVWKLEPDSWVTKTLQAIADELARVDARGDDLIEESDPRTTTEMIEDWERALSLPDEQVLTIPATLAERRVAVTQKYVSRGGQTNADFVALALACGYTVTVSNYNALLCRSGRARAGVGRLYGLASAYSMLVTTSAETADALSHADFERVIRHATHAHITVVFAY